MSESMTQLLARLEALVERAESELLAAREDNHSMMMEIDGLRTERDRLAAELQKLWEQKPVVVTTGEYSSEYTMALLPRKAFPIGTKLYAAPVPAAPAPAVPEEWRKFVGFLAQQTTFPHPAVCICQACTWIKKARALLQSAEVTK